MLICETLDALYAIYSDVDYDEILSSNFIATFKPTVKVLEFKTK